MVTDYESKYRKYKQKYLQMHHEGVTRLDEIRYGGANVSIGDVEPALEQSKALPALIKAKDAMNRETKACEKEKLHLLEEFCGPTPRSIPRLEREINRWRPPTKIGHGLAWNFFSEGDARDAVRDITKLAIEVNDGLQIEVENLGEEVRKRNSMIEKLENNTVNFDQAILNELFKSAKDLDDLCKSQRESADKLIKKVKRNYPEVILDEDSPEWNWRKRARKDAKKLAKVAMDSVKRLDKLSRSQRDMVVKLQLTAKKAAVKAKAKADKEAKKAKAKADKDAKKAKKANS
jgi:hypothetical protein